MTPPAAAAADDDEAHESNASHSALNSHNTTRLASPLPLPTSLLAKETPTNEVSTAKLLTNETSSAVVVSTISSTGGFDSGGGVVTSENVHLLAGSNQEANNSCQSLSVSNTNRYVPFLVFSFVHFNACLIISPFSTHSHPLFLPAIRYPMPTVTTPGHPTAHLTQQSTYISFFLYISDAATQNEQLER
jgi:hypothetical protein